MTVCHCGAPLPLHLWSTCDALTHICSCERVWRFRDGAPVHRDNEREFNPFVRHMQPSHNCN